MIFWRPSKTLGFSFRHLSYLRKPCLGKKSRLRKVFPRHSFAGVQSTGPKLRREKCERADNQQSPRPAPQGKKGRGHRERGLPKRVTIFSSLQVAGNCQHGDIMRAPHQHGHCAPRCVPERVLPFNHRMRNRCAPMDVECIRIASPREGPRADADGQTPQPEENGRERQNDQPGTPACQHRHLPRHRFSNLLAPRYSGVRPTISPAIKDGQQPHK